MLSGGNQTDGNTLERFLTPYQYSTLPLIRIDLNQGLMVESPVSNPLSHNIFSLQIYRSNPIRYPIFPPSLLRNPDYYKRISDPVDLSTIEKNLMTGKYKSVEAFDSDFLKVFKNSEVSWGHLLIVFHQGLLDDIDYICICWHNDENCLHWAISICSLPELMTKWWFSCPNFMVGNLWWPSLFEDFCDMTSCYN